MFDEKFKFNGIQLNSELHFASIFIYDACKDIISLEKNIHDREAKLCNIFYKVSVGIERFQKIIVVLSINASSQKELDNSGNNLLKKHSHHALGHIIECENSITVSKKARNLLQYLQNFYKKNRYGYFSFQNKNNTNNMTYNLLLEFAKIDEFRKNTGNESLIAALEIFKECLSELINVYVELIKEKSDDYFTIESESNTKWFAILHYKGNIFSAILQRELAIKEFILELIEKETKYSYYADKEDYVEHLNDLVFGETCSRLVEQISEGFYENNIEIDEFSQEQLTEKILEIEYNLNIT